MSTDTTQSVSVRKSNGGTSFKTFCAYTVRFLGIRGIPVGFSILTGACVVLWLLSVFRGHNRELMIVSSVLMTAGCGALAVGKVDNLHTLWGILVLAGLGIGGIVVPASIITSTFFLSTSNSPGMLTFSPAIICPDDLIATIAALTLAIRVIGGSVGYCIYYNVFISKFVPAATYYIGGAMELELNITSTAVIGEAITITGASLLPLLEELPGIKGVPGAYELVVAAGMFIVPCKAARNSILTTSIGQLAYAEAYKYVYYVSIAFGCISIIAAVFLGDISKYMDDHVAVVMH